MIYIILCHEFQILKVLWLSSHVTSFLYWKHMLIPCFRWCAVLLKENERKGEMLD